MHREQSTGCGENLFICEGSRQKPEPSAFLIASAFLIVCAFAAATEDQNWDFRQTGMQFGDKCRAANAPHVVSGDDQPKVSGELRSLNQAEGLSCIVYPLHIAESPLQDRLALKRLQGIVVHQ
jgi:hypothetical protein